TVVLTCVSVVSAGGVYGVGKSRSPCRGRGGECPCRLRRSASPLAEPSQGSSLTVPEVDSYLFIAVDNTASFKVVWAKFNHHTVFRQNANIVLTHFARYGGKYDVVVI